MILLNSTILNSIRCYGESAYPEECCGIILGTDGPDGKRKAEEIIPVANAKEDEKRHNRFLITSETLMQAELLARRKKLDVIGFYHSHPDHPAAPSEYDREHAWPFYSYIIVSVIAGQAEDMTSWRLEEVRNNFKEETIGKEN